MQDLERTVEGANPIQIVKFENGPVFDSYAATQKITSHRKRSYATFIPPLAGPEMIPGIVSERPNKLELVANSIDWLKKFSPSAEGIIFEFDWDFWTLADQAERRSIIKHVQEYAASQNLNLEYCGPVQ